MALHRAAHLARANPDARVLLTTFSNTLAASLSTKLKRLLSGEPQVDVYSLDAIGLRLHKLLVGPASVADRDTVVGLVRDASAAVGGHKFGLPFLLGEWDDVADAWQLASSEAYREVQRLGRKTRLTEAHRRTVWAVFEECGRAWPSAGL